MKCETELPTKAGTPHLRRVLTLWDLIWYGIVAVTPCAPAMVYGLADVKSGGHAVLTILLGMAASVLTAISYGRMAALYPSAGSVYSYVSQGIHPYLGFAAGWALLLDYMLTPLFSVLYGTLSLHRAFPSLPYSVGSALFAACITFLNLRGIRSTARTNEVLLTFMFVVLGAFIVLAMKYVISSHGIGALFSKAVFYKPNSFSVRGLWYGTSFAALTYLGFDSVTMLAEEVENPRRNVLISIVTVCVFTGLFGGLLVYLAQLVWPDYNSFTNLETAFIDVTHRVGGVFLFQAVAAMLVISNIGSGLTCQAGAARILFGMGRENVIPQRIFGNLHPLHNTPDRNVILIGVVAFVGAQVLSYELTADLLTFGAFLAFMAVNAAVFWTFWVRRSEGRQKNIWIDLVLPMLGFLFCAVIWWGLATPAKLVGAGWFVLGLCVVIAHTRWFRQPMLLADPSSYQ